MESGREPNSDSVRIWRCRGCDVRLTRPRIMGIVNVTPDSFSDGGLYVVPDQAIAHGIRLASEGAELLDVGGESTRPGAEVVSPDEELRRVIPVVQALVAQSGVPVTIDTRHAIVAHAALAAGACAVNDVIPFTDDPDMVEVIRESGAGVVLMHMRGTPQTMMEHAVYDDVVGEVEASLREKLICAEAVGIARECIMLDPGIGFAKTTAHNLALLAATARLASMGPLLVGASRKRFIGEVCGGDCAPDERQGGSIAVAAWCAQQGAAIVRVHDVKATQQALAMVQALTEAALGIKNV